MSKYKIIDEIPDGVEEKDIEEKYCIFFTPFRWTDMIGINIRKKINDLFVNAPDDYHYRDMADVVCSNLFERHDIIFYYNYISRDKKHNIKYLYDIEKNKYYRLNYFPRNEDLTEEHKKTFGHISSFISISSCRIIAEEHIEKLELPPIEETNTLLKNIKRLLNTKFSIVRKMFE